MSQAKPRKELGHEYLFAGRLSAKDWRAVIVLNIGGLLLLPLFGWLFWLIARTLRSESFFQDSSSLISGIDLTGLILGALAVLILHELVHGLFFLMFTGERPHFGLSIFYAYAAAPDWYLPRNRFMIIGIAPFALISLAGVVGLLIIPSDIVNELLIILTINAAGSVGDLLVVGWLLGQPRTMMINDQGAEIKFYKMAGKNMTDLNKRWLDLFTSLGVDPDKAREEYAKLVENYNEAGRYYHNFDHIGMVFETADAMRHMAEDYTLIEIAIWFHDVVYDPRAKDNEVRSAAYARRVLGEMGLPEEMIERVSDLILATITHIAQDGDIDAQILLDADLAPLAYDQNVFFEQSDSLRQEFYYIPDEQYSENRVKALRSFLERERIYQTEKMYDALEEKARDNLTQAIKTLSD